MITIKKLFKFWINALLRIASFFFKWYFFFEIDFKNIDAQFHGRYYNKIRHCFNTFFFSFLVISGLWLSSFCVMPNSSSKITIICTSIIFSTSILVYMTTYVPIFVELPPDLCKFIIIIIIIFLKSFKLVCEKSYIKVVLFNFAYFLFFWVVQENIMYSNLFTLFQP